MIEKFKNLLFITYLLNIFIVVNGQSKLIINTLKDPSNIGSIPSYISKDIFEENPTIAFEQALLGPFRIDPDMALTCGQWIESRSFQYERHYVITKDGYILQNYRIINPYAKKFCEKRKPVLLVHPLITSCSYWLYNSPGGHIEPWIDGKPPNDTSVALAFHLANRGYEVWLINVRGTSYSTNHTHLNPYTDPEFWDYTFQDIGLYDVTATVDYIKRVTAYERITVVALSQGTIQMLVQMSAMPEYQKNYDIVILVAPVSYLADAKGLLPIILEPILIERVLAALRLPIFPFLSVINSLLSLFCSLPINQPICLEIVNSLIGSDSPQLNVSRLSVYASQLDRSSAKNFAHLGQFVRFDHNRAFDYGKTKNLDIYGSTEPPIFPYHLINASKLILMRGLNDDFATPRSVQKLLNSLDGEPLVDHIFTHPIWAHADAQLAIEGYQYFSSIVRQFIEKYADN